MTPEERFQAHYAEGTAPWDVGKPDFNLIQIVGATPIAACKALDIGCGTGDNAIWLSQHGFDVIGVDLSGLAIAQARQKAAEANAACKFDVMNILKSKVVGAPFGFVFDRGCFHTMNSGGERHQFVKRVYGYLNDGGLWLSLIGSADRPPSAGPPTRTAQEIAQAVERYFEILSLVSSHFETKLPEAPKAWVCLLRKRRPS